MSSKDRVTNNLVTLGSAAVLTVYAAGFVRTRAAAERFAAETAERHPAPLAKLAVALPEPPPPSVVSIPVAPAPESERHSNKPAPVTAPAPAPTSVAKPAVPSAKTVDSTPAPSSTQPVVTPIRDSSKTETVAKTTDSTQAIKGFKDGIFFGWGTSRHGDIQAGLEIKNGRIVSAFISECLTQYSCSWISLLPPQVLARQSAEVDYVSGATQSSNAFYYALVDALKKAK